MNNLEDVKRIKSACGEVLITSLGLRDSDRDTMSFWLERVLSEMRELVNLAAALCDTSDTVCANIIAQSIGDKLIE